MADNLPLSAIRDMVREAEKHAEEMSGDRIRALEYYRGEMNDMPADSGRSAMVSRDVRAYVKKVLPSVMRTLLGGDNVVEYQPIGEGDEEAAEQATDFVNLVLMHEADIHRSVEDAIHDALLQRNGILKWWFEERQTTKTSRHSGLTEDALAVLVQDDDVEVLEASTTQEQTEDGQTVDLYDVKIKRTFADRRYRTASVPRERFLIHPDAVTLQDSLLTGEKTEMRRSDLVAMGYDSAMIRDLPVSDAHDDEDAERRDRSVSGKTEAQKANEPLDYYDLFVRIDMDGDGIAELRHMVFAGGLKDENLLVDEEADEVQFCDLAVMHQPHQWEGISLFDDLKDLQQAKTVLLRQTLDNLYWQNNPQPVMVQGMVVNPDAVFNPAFGLPIQVREGSDARAAVQFMQVPFVAQQSFGMLDYLDNEASDRTGVTDASAGMAPDALQNVTAKASAMIEQQGIGQTEMMVRTLAGGLKTFFRGILRLIVQHQDMPRTVRLRGKWTTFDPRSWNADMDCTVNTGLGAGTRERDMAVMQAVLGLQEKMIAGFGPDNPFVKPENLYATLSKMVESAGLRTPSLFFTEPDPEEIKAKMEAQAQQPSPEQQKLEMQMQLEQAKMQSAQAKEQAQMDADLTVKQAEIAAETERQRNDLASKAALQGQQLAWDREKFTMELAARAEEAAQRRQEDVLRAQAERFRATLQERVA